VAKRDNSPKKRQTAKKLTGNQREWQHQVANLKRRIRDLQGLGAAVDFQIPQMPTDKKGNPVVRKRDIQRIKNITRKELLKHAYQEGQYGEAVQFQPPERGKAKQRRKEVKLKRWLEERENQPTIFDEDYQDDEGDYWFEGDYNPDLDYAKPVEIYDVEIGNLRALIYDIADDEIAEKLSAILDKAIADKGANAVGEVIEKRYSELREAAQQALMYKGLSKGAGAITSFAQILTSEPLSFGELADLERANDFNDNFDAP